MAVSQKGVCIGILISILLIMIIYIIILFECYKNKTFVFTPYKAPPPPTDENPFYPTGEIRDLSPEELAQRDCIVACGLNNDCECFNKLTVDEDMIN